MAYDERILQWKERTSIAHDLVVTFSGHSVSLSTAAYADDLVRSRPWTQAAVEDVNGFPGRHA